jgi:malate dehydrogenase (oxaloacetate-decarboxylating)
MQAPRVSDEHVFAVHAGGKISVVAKTPVRDADDLAAVYTPGVAKVCLAIAADPSRAYDLTIKQNSVAVVSDGSAVLGLGDIGPAAAMPVMEGKAMLFKDFAGVDAYPICLDERDPDRLVDIISALATGFGGINLEDISAPRCFEVEGKLRQRLDIPVFHDDQHGTAIVVLAALSNALELVGKPIGPDLRVVVQGIGAAGVAVTNLLLAAGIVDLVGVDQHGIVTQRRKESRDPIFRRLGKQTNPRHLEGHKEVALSGADVFIGVSAGGTLDLGQLDLMADDAIVFALANPTPEIDPAIARRRAAVVATGRSDEPNQINNVLCFPGLFRGLLDSRAREVSTATKLAAAAAIAAVVPRSELGPERIIPSPFDRGVVPAVAAAVAGAAGGRGSGVSPRTWVAVLRAAVAALDSPDARAARSRSQFLAELDRLPQPFDEHADPTHVTASAIVVGPGGVLLHRHKRMGIWLQPGGHVDAGEAPWDAAVREVAEETGLVAAHPSDGPRLVHVDVHAAPRGHVHLDARYLLHADGQPCPPPGESQDVRWFTWSAAIAVADAGLVGALAILRPP